MRAFIPTALGALVKKGLVVLVLTGILLLIGNPTTVKAQITEEYITEFAAIAAEAAQHFGSNVAVYEIWNEEDLHSPASIYLPPGDYARLLDAAYGAIKANSSSTVIVGGLASGNTGYLSSVISAQGGNLKADGVGVHPYIINIGALRAKVQEYLGASQGKPLWITEFGWETTNQEDQANYLEQAFNVFRSFARIRSSAWYCWSDRMGPGFGLITVSGTPKLAYQRFPRGEGVNIDPIHSDTPSAAQLRDLGAGWVRMVYRPQMSIDFDGLIQGYKNAGIETILILNQETLWSEDLPPAAYCEPRMGTKVLAAPDPTPSALKERVRAECTGNWLQRKICDVIRAIIDFFRDESFQYRQTTGPAALLRVQQQALNSVGETYEGIIARMLRPQYRQMGADPMRQLSKAEGQKAEGEVISNEGQAQTEFNVGSGQYEVSEENYTNDYVLDAKFPDIPALVDKYGFIRQGFVPQAPLASLPYVNCPTSSRLIEFDEPIRDVEWEAQTEGGQEVPCVPNDPDDPDCRDEPLPHPPAECPGTCTPGEWFNPPEEEDQEEGTPNCGYCGCQPGYSAQCNAFGTWSCLWNPGLCGDEKCPCTGATSVYVEAPVDTQTDVALVEEAWNNIAGGSKVDASGNILKVGGALDIFTLPGANFKPEPSLEAKSPFIYNSETIGTINSQATLPIAYMGGVEGAFSCVTDQLLAPPSSAAEGVCEEWMENLPGEEEEASLPTRQAVLGQRTAKIQQSGGFWANLGNLVGRLLRLILSL